MVSFIGLFGEAIVPILKGLGQPYKVTAIEAVQSLVLIVSVWVLASRYGLIGAVLAWLPAIAVSQGVCGFFAKQVLYRPFDGLKAPLIAIISASAVGAVVAFGVDSKLPGVIGFVIANFCALVVFAILLWKSDRWLKLGLAHGLARIFPQIAALVGYSLAES
jgi:O-antigen/teichoic acid export membrane protein